ncbi:MAG: sugar phosphate nucleotidyltransferase [Candidatus Diapherotrites archaeon]|nr:sugar phosphate nucleotidyltransferase [Candidatus Diapherotrites archaeon]
MKGVILAGGKGTRLLPLTLATNKHLLPVYDKPMIFYPLQTLKDAGIKDVLIIIDPENAGAFLRILGSGLEFGVNLTFRIQDSHVGFGIAGALSLAEDFCKNDCLAVILGDNIFEDSFKSAIADFEKKRNGSCVFLKKVPDPSRFGVAELNGEKVVSIEEKPKKPKSDFAVTGFYIYDNNVFDLIKKIKPSGRGELEITDVNKAYLANGSLAAKIVSGFWSDAGTIPSLQNASELVKGNAIKNKACSSC